MKPVHEMTVNECWKEIFELRKLQDRIKLNHSVEFEAKARIRDLYLRIEVIQGRQCPYLRFG